VSRKTSAGGVKKIFLSEATKEQVLKILVAKRQFFVRSGRSLDFF